ncbi:proteasome regulatory particle subunit [Yamadazyma tenuis]|uniref:PCI domain-containing protein n=1 Tax=Candida tenuis (strain ATCC 10573 / BCRC 21748 / CBS 615 / JCM 9827 / NBRC 10315 / NRRL Y-1498 / VKM Y-70) TaxID=590646 RepID=G3B4Z5_CANTC|nr:uncharacterized protein CANTEDRAFT_114060 [Yamadazyma tenuis ATCC 10573]EGV64024.1 hypothetical protein CANTEDRAFT_114060 [Yamadazyma tenuis ATCC 10573]WEJ96356.1 proteasome regulatory particle subunit [Yamadazyma tenuis]
MSREDPLKAEKDLSSILDEQFPEIDKLDYKSAIDRYLILEKQTRQSSDLASSKRVLSAIVNKLIDNNDWDYLNELTPILSKKHGQLKSSIQSFIAQIIENLDKLDESKQSELDTKIKVIETIRTVGDKKIYIEVERAIVSKQLSDIYLNRLNDLDKAVEILCDLQVETYSLMSFQTKIEYILQQMKLVLTKKDFSQAKILSRKILLKTLKGFDKAEEYKVVYLNYLIEINENDHDYVSIVQNSLKLIESEVVQNSEEFKNILVSVIYYIILSPFDNLQSDLISKIKVNSTFSKNVDAKTFKLLEIFTTEELIHWSNIETLYSNEFKSSKIFQNPTNYKNLQKRIIEHNLRIINNYYNFIKIDRLSYLLQLSNDEAEKYVSDLVNAGMISAKINRPKGMIKFDKVGKTTDSVNTLLNDWCYDVEKLLDEIDQIGHLINKEEMMHGIKQKS